MNVADDFLAIGRIVDVYGLKGWVKIRSFTEPETNFLNYSHCFYQDGKQWKPLKLEHGKIHGKGLVVKFAGFDDRTAAEALLKLDLVVKSSELPALDAGEYYWHQLEKLDVYAVSETEEKWLGRIDHLLETGSNDVLVVKPCEGSIDKRERLLPYRPEVVVKVDIPSKKMLVDWDIDF